MDGQSELFVGTQSMIGTRETHSPQFQLEILAKLLCVAGVQYIFVLTHNKSNEALASKDEFIGYMNDRHRRNCVYVALRKSQ